LLTTLLAATLPGLVVCYATYRADRYDREPIVPLVLSFLAGALVTWPALESELWLMDITGLDYSRSPWETFVFAYGFVALLEELLKLLILLVIFPRRFFDEPVDGIVYAVMVGMGFATVENLFYAERFGIETLWLRAFTAVPAHLVFAIVMGYYLGKAKFLSVKGAETPRIRERNRLIIKGLIVAMLLHGTYDWLMFQHWWKWLLMLATTSLYLCLFYCTELIGEHLDNSPFRYKRPY
jgi:protease PrsW